MTDQSSAPDQHALLSVVVTVVEGGEALLRCLRALQAQLGPPPMEVLVPFDASIGELRSLRNEFPGTTFLDLGAVAAASPTHSAAGQHELYDRRRAAGLAAARGDLVAIIEDRGAPRPDWARTAVRLHSQYQFGVIGGAIEPVYTGLLNWAFWACDFSRYGLPFVSGPVSWVSDVNVTYKRAALENTRHLWQDRYQEPVVHWELLGGGETLYLSNDLVVHHRTGPMRLAQLLPQRFRWGQLFGAMRARHSSRVRRLAFILLSPAIPLVLLTRQASDHIRRGQAIRFIRAMPLLLPLLIAWTAGETWGQITGRT